MNELDVAILDAVQGVTKKWAQQRKAEERSTRRASDRRYVFRARALTVKDAAYSVMEAAYLRASSNGQLPANARQIMYAARPRIQQMTGKPLNDAYFTQVLLPDYMEACGVNWDVVFDARGHFEEPHTQRLVPLGTIGVRDYLAGRSNDHRRPRATASPRYPTHGPANRYSAVIFIEKEGFGELFRAAGIAERYDVAIMSTKGMSVTASRTLIASLHVPVLVLHDFDQAGFAIIGTLRRSTRRFRYHGKPHVIDIGLTLDDIEQYGLEAEYQQLRQSAEALRRNGATTADIAFLAEDQRVELNMLTSEQFVEMVEAKLEANGIGKVVPEREVLEAAYRRAFEVRAIEAAADKVAKEAAEAAAAAVVPEDIGDRVRDYLEENPGLPWDDALFELAAERPEAGS